MSKHVVNIARMTCKSPPQFAMKYCAKCHVKFYNYSTLITNLPKHQ